jgi:hypothetical protein
VVSQKNCWRNIAITLTTPQSADLSLGGSGSYIPLHEQSLGAAQPDWSLVWSLIYSVSRRRGLPEKTWAEDG